jgi:hypothetical protein
MISCILPISKEDNESNLFSTFKPQLDEAIKHCEEEVEVITIVGNSFTDRSMAQNTGAIKAKGDTLVFLYVDNGVSKNLLNEVSEKARNPYFIGGGVKYIKIPRYSLGLVTWLVLLALYLYVRRITLGTFWVRKDVFYKLQGFKSMKYEDVDFALRLKKYAKLTNRKFESLKRSHIIFNTRKFDKHGDWHWLKGYHIN